MPRGRPKKTASVAVTEPTKIIVEPIIEAPGELLIEPTRDIMDTTTEPIQTPTSPHEASSTQLMWDRAEQELKRLHSKRGALEKAIDEKQILRNTLQFQHQKAEAAHREALDAFNALSQDFTLAKQRLHLGKNTPAESELLKALKSLEEEHTSAKTTLDNSQKILEDALRAFAESDYLLVECDQHISGLEELTNQYQMTEQICQEQKALRGREIAQSIIASINEARDYQRQVKEASEAKLQATIGRIELELSGEWPELVDEIAEAFRENVEDVEDVEENSPGQVDEAGEAAPGAKNYEEESEQTSNPTVKLCLAWISFLQALRKHGPQSKKVINGISLVDTLSLQPGRMLQFMQPSNWRYMRERDSSGREIYRWSNNEIEIVRNIIQQEETSTQDAFWGTLPSQRW